MPVGTKKNCPLIFDCILNSGADPEFGKGGALC